MAATRLVTAHTADLLDDELAAARALLFDVFDDMTEPDWEHCLGGVHALLVEGGAVIAHAALVQRRLLHDGRALRAGYVEGVAVRRDRQRRGHGTALMTRLGSVIRRAYEVGALASSDEGLPFYAASGWQPWTGPAAALTPDGVVPTPDAVGAVFVLPVSARLDPSVPLVCDWRDGDVW